MGAKARFVEIFRSAFTRLSIWKRLLLRVAIALAVLGIIGQAVSLASGVSEAQGAGETSSGTWSWSALSSGFGCLLGFVIGASFRIFLKLGLIVAGAVALGMFAGSYLGWFELPWDSLSDMGAASGRFVTERATGLRDALTSVLPSSTMTAIGLFAGVTQRPRTDTRATSAPEPS